MSDEKSVQPTALEIARSLLAGDAAPGNGSDPEQVAAALERVCARVASSLRDSMGVDGCNALLARALARAEIAHPALKDFGRFDGGRVRMMEGIAAMVKAHGVATATAAIEAMLATLVDVLSRLIGEEMAIRLIDPGALWAGSGEGTQQP